MQPMLQWNYLLEIIFWIYNETYPENSAIDCPAYTDDNVSTKVVKLIQSYVGIINKMVWRKE